MKALRYRFLIEILSQEIPARFAAEAADKLFILWLIQAKNFMIMLDSNNSNLENLTYDDWSQWSDLLNNNDINDLISILKNKYQFKIYYCSDRIGFSAELLILQDQQTKIIKGPPQSSGNEILQKFLNKQNYTMDNEEIFLTNIEEKNHIYHALQKTIQLNKDHLQIKKNLAAACGQSLHNFTWPQSIIYEGSKGQAWIRPIMNILAIAERNDNSLINSTNISISNNQLIEFEFAGLHSSSNSMGHKILSVDNLQTMQAKILPIDQISKYEQILKENFVLIDPGKRRQHIIEQAIKLNSNFINYLAIDNQEHINDNSIIYDNQRYIFKPSAGHIADLIDELSCIAAWPNIMICSIAQQFMQLPKELIEYTMITNQRYIPLIDQQNQLLKEFVVIIDHISPSEQMRKGYEKVLFARLLDSEFFYQDLLRSSPQQLLNDLKKQIAEQNQYNLSQYCEKIAQLAQEIYHTSSYYKKYNPSSIPLNSNQILSPSSNHSKNIHQDISSEISHDYINAEKHSTDTQNIAYDNSIKQINLDYKNDYISEPINLSADLLKLSYIDLSSKLIDEYPALRGIISGYFWNNQLNFLSEQYPHINYSLIKENAFNIYYNAGEIYIRQSFNQQAYSARLFAISEKILRLRYLFLQKKQNPTSSRDPFALKRDVHNLFDLVVCPLNHATNLNNATQINESIFDVDLFESLFNSSEEIPLKDHDKQNCNSKEIKYIQEVENLKNFVYKNLEQYMISLISKQDKLYSINKKIINFIFGLFNNPIANLRIFNEERLNLQKITQLNKILCQFSQKISMEFNSSYHRIRQIYQKKHVDINHLNILNLSEHPNAVLAIQASINTVLLSHGPELELYQGLLQLQNELMNIIYSNCSNNIIFDIENTNYIWTNHWVLAYFNLVIKWQKPLSKLIDDFLDQVLIDHSQEEIKNNRINLVKWTANILEKDFDLGEFLQQINLK